MSAAVPNSDFFVNNSLIFNQQLTHIMHSMCAQIYHMLMSHNLNLVIICTIILFIQCAIAW